TPSSNTRFWLSQDIRCPGKLDLKASIASRGADAESQQIEAARLSITARVKQAYYRLAYTYAVGDVLTRNRDLLDTLLKVSENRYAVGQARRQVRDRRARWPDAIDPGGRQGDETRVAHVHTRIDRWIEKV